ncbi:DUF3298 and DUF4163 domain-containing protein [Fusibacter sp. 3D3]|uniref:DUF3298 and DUF4163 domain-containing protein n=1 Tax=Fusibacter sp. 3D3 TaxID=1048380 RepID=UPI0008536ABE|nr:DUF3298 and DUF4163 domain-containing protein [Fusibacter sp. 3D3]GAU78792.1 conserved protein [Fusibacter sp. 3D3]
MKKYKFLFTFIFVVFLVSSCEVQPSEPEPTTKSIEIPVESTKPIEPEPTEAELSFVTIENKINEVFLNYAEHYDLIGNLENTKIRTHINQSIEYVINKSKNNAIQIERSLYDPSAETPLEIEITGKPIYFNDQVLSYEIVYKSKDANAEENLSYTFLNYDLASGQPVKLKDLIPLDQLYSQIEKVYPKSYEEPFNREHIELYNLNQSFHFKDENNAVFVISPYELTYEQKQFIKVPLTDIKYEPSKKMMLGTSILNSERIENTEYYDIFFSYPHFDGLGKHYSEINQTVKQHANEFYDYGVSMALLDHNSSEQQIIDNPDAAIAPPDLEAPEENVISTEDSEITTENSDATNLNPSDFVLPTYWYNLSYEIYTNNEKILSFGLYDYQYTGGAHGLSSGSFYSYDLELGKQIELKDLFEPKFDYITYINDQIYRKVDQETKKNSESSYAYYDFSGIDENVKFYIEDNELVIFFDQYEIAAYAAGTPTFRIPLP